MSVDFQVNVNVKTNGKEAIDQLEQKINSLKSSNIPINFDVTGAEEIKNVLSQINAIKKQKVKVEYDVGSSGKGKSIPEQIQKQLNSQKIKYDIDTGKYDASLSKMTKQLDAYGGQASDSISRAKASLESYQRELSSLQDHFSGKKILNDEEFTASVERMNKAGDTFKNTLSQISSETTKSLQLGVAERSANKVEAYYNANTKAAKKYGAELKELEQRYRSMSTQGEKLELDNTFNNLKSKISAEGLTGKSTLDSISNSVRKVGEFAGIFSITQNMAMDIPGKIVQAVRDVNAAQIELTKVSDAPQSELSQYWDEAADSAKKYGAAISDVISSTADWSRLGYSLNEAKELSDATTLLQRVGDNMTQESSAQGMISTLKGFNLEADQAMDIVDKVNEVANTQPIDTSGMFESLQRSASSMSAANNSLEQTMALITAANSVVQDPDRIGNAFKTISMRIRGASTELEEAGLDTEGMAESTAKLREEVLALSGVDIMKSDSEFKATYDILDELATKWQDLTDIEQAKSCLYVQKCA